MTPAPPSPRSAPRVASALQRVSDRIVDGRDPKSAGPAGASDGNDMVCAAGMAHFHVRADSRDIPEGGLKSIAAAVIEIPSGETHGVGTSFEGPLDMRLDTSSPVLLVLVDGTACAYPGQLHPLTASSMLILDALGAAVRTFGEPPSGREASWLTDLLIDANARVLGVALGSLGGTLAVVLLAGDHAFCAHVGDVVVAVGSPRDEFAPVELTEDHTLLRSLREKQVASEIEAELANVLTRWFGASNAAPDVRAIPVLEGDLVFLAPRSIISGVMADVAIDRSVLRNDKGVWQQLVLDEARRRHDRSPVLLIAERLS